MKKKNNMGFALAETLIVSTVVAGILIYLFIQFSALKRSYNNSFAYNTVNNLYALEDVFDYVDNLSSSTKSNILNSIDDNNYVEINKSNDEYTDNVNDEQIVADGYGYNLLNALDIKNLVITKESFDYSTIDSDNIKQGFKTFMSKIKVTDGDDYRLIAQFTDGTYATIIVPLEVD